MGRSKKLQERGPYVDLRLLAKVERMGASKKPL
jgi:hypothetical protein